MNETMTVAPGVDLTANLAGKRITKKWVLAVAATMPEKDWRNLGPGYSYVSINNAVEYGIDLQVRDPKTLALVALVTTNRITGEVKVR